MAADNWSAEGGAAAGGTGTTVTTANSGGSSGNAFGGAAGISGGNTMVYSTAQTMHGSYSVLVDRSSGSTPAYVQRTISGSPARAVTRVYVRFAAFPAGNTGIVRIQNTSASNAASLFVDSAGKFVLQNAAGTAVFTATSALSTNTWYRVEVALAPGTTTSTGAAELAYYTGDGTTAIQTMTPITTGNFGTVAAVGFVRLGRYDTSATTGGYYFDDFATESKGSGLIGPAGVTPPTAASVGTDNIYSASMLTSTAGIAGALTFSVVWNAGEVLTYTEPVDGVFNFVKSTVGTSQYKGTVSETGGGSADVLIDIPQLVAGTLVSYGPKVWNGSVWV